MKTNLDLRSEHIRVHIENALDLLQLITEDVEANLVTANADSVVKARATMTISALYVLSDYLRDICEEGSNCENPS